MALVFPFRGKAPRIAPDVFLAPTAVVIGDVVLGPGSSVWFGAVLRGDHPQHPIVVGARVSVQDQVVLHVGDPGPTLIEDDVTLGHGALLESCRVGAGSLVGMNAVLLQGATIGRECMVAAGAVVKENARFPDRSVVAGVPAALKKTLDGAAATWVGRSAQHYVELSRLYLAEGLGAAPEGDAQTCERCGFSMYDRHCKVVCPNCGYLRDCSDP
ncbi:MAG: gamma carbonic anhydrase family protein [Gemmatimonadota bacterium]|nr:gamma carbonic anhydrase family protein [Gemmatimonadota bacterium]